MEFQDARNLLTRRCFFGRSAIGLGAAALGSLMSEDLCGADSVGLPGLPHFAPTAKRVIYLFQSGGPSQIELFDYKPRLKELIRTDLPDSVRRGQRLTEMSAGQASFPVAPSLFDFKQHGQSGAWISDLMPHLAGVADELCFVKSMYTEQINHDPAVTFFQTGFQLAGRPSIGSWLAYGLGSENRDLPAFVVMISQGTGNPNDQPLADRQWGSGFLPTTYQGIKFRSIGDPVLYLSNPEGFSAQARRRFIDDVGRLNQLQLEEFGDPEISTRIAQYEMAYRMQSSVPNLTDLSSEPDSTFDLYGEDARKPGTFAANCLLARRLAERDVRFVQLFHRGWDQHSNLPKQIPGQAKDIDQACAGLITDLKQRGMLEDTLVIWGGEFGRTIYSQGTLTPTDYGRDHHPRCFSLWLAGAGIKGGMVHGETDEFSYNIIKDPVHVRDFQATILHTFGIDHERFTYKYQGLDQRLTGVEPAKAVKQILA
jgi:hypothetical protein